MKSFFHFGKSNPSPKASSDGIKRLWLDMGDPGVFVFPSGAHDPLQDRIQNLMLRSDSEVTAYD